MMRWLAICGRVLLLTISLAVEAHAGTITGAVTTPKPRDRENVVVYIDRIPGKTFPAPEKHALMQQRGLTFIPHVLPALVGTTVDFLNSDDVLHNVFTPDQIAEKFNLGTWPKGEIRSYTFKQPGNAVILCQVHAEMEAYVVVLETPYFAVAGKDGTYTLPDVPEGTYVLKTWHERLKPQEVHVTVSEGKEAVINFELTH